MNKPYNINYILLSIISMVVSLSQYHNIFGKIFVYIQCFFIIFTLVKNKKKAVDIYILFSLSCSLFPPDLRLLSNDFNMHNFAKLKFLGPINYSYIIFLILLMYKNTKKLSAKKNEYYDFFIATFILLIIGFFNGAIALIIEFNNMQAFKKSLIYNLYFIMSIVLIKLNYEDKLRELEKLINSLMIATPISMLLLKALGVSGYYGGISKLAFPEIYEFSFLLILAPFYYKKNYKIMLFSGALSVYLSKDAAGGKAIIFLIFFIIIFLLKTINYIYKQDKIYVFLNSLGVILISMLFLYKDKISSNSKLTLAKIKFNSVYSLLNLFKKSSDIESLKNSLSLISHSPRVRIISIINIIDKYLNEPYLAILGSGYGGYFEDKLGFFSKIKLNTADFSIIELRTNKFSNVHGSIPNLILQNGLIGIFYIVYWSFKFLKKITSNYYASSSFLWIIFMYGFNNNIALIGAIFICLTLNYKNKVRRRRSEKKIFNNWIFWNGKHRR